ncbi:MAG: hypothetical protein IT432_14875 [Phycisphaerales bacterium]|nr:hypothetical protein [Phycisphaerales bacterium]
MTNNGLMSQGTPSPPADANRRKFGWSEGREGEALEDKRRMADHFVNHDFLTKPAITISPSDSRENAALVMVTLGTTPNAVVEESLKWMVRQWERNGPFNVRWYTPGARVASTLQRFRKENPATRSAGNLYLLPGPVDQDTEGVLGDVPESFVAETLGGTGFKHTILSAYSFDLDNGVAKFWYKDEIGLQRSVALRTCEHAFLFLDPSKFRAQGEVGYSLEEMLDPTKSRSRLVTIYTVGSDANEVIRSGFLKLWQQVAKNCGFTVKTNRLRLCIVGRPGEAPEVLPSAVSTEVTNEQHSNDSERLPAALSSRSRS